MYTRIALVFFVCLFGTLSAQVTLKGKVKSTSGELLAFATVKSISAQKGTSSTFDGQYSLKLSKGEHIIEVAAFGFQKLNITIVLDGNLEKDFVLRQDVQEIEEVVISRQPQDKNVESVEMSVETLEMEEVKKLPAFMGEVDVIKTIQLLPGVTTVGEGASGFNVRGGNSDQNLVLMDNAPIYNSSHLFGFFSIFNSDAVRDIKLYKGGIPSNYGGRLSSVLDINQAEGNSEKISGAGGIGVVSSRLTVGGPIVKDSTSRGAWILAGRRSYADVFLRFSSDTSLRQNIAYFYDLNGKLSYKLNDKNKIYLSSYFGRDVFSFGDDFGFDWGNGTATLALTHTYSDSLFANVSFVYSNFDYDIGVPDGENAFSWESGIQNYNLNIDFDRILSSKSKIKYGLQLNTYMFKPGEAKPGPDNVDFQPVLLQNERALEPNLYISHDYKLNNKITIQYGLRYSSFYQFGLDSGYTYKEGESITSSSTTGIEYYDYTDIVNQFHGFEPRLGIKYGLDSTSSVKLSYNRTRQYVHLISNTTSSIPFDVWKSAGLHVDPAIADQIAGGYFRNFDENTYEGSVELYYKKYKNLVDYKDGAQLIANNQLETDLLKALGRAYGVEFMLRKKKGKFTGWFSYTWAKTERKIDTEFEEDKINNGDWYPSNYDKRHDLTFVAAYDISKRLTVSTNFTYAQGRPITLSDSRFSYNGQTYFNYADRNSSRIPDYHRLDLSVTLQGKKNDIRRWQSSWVLSIYNVYGRKNAYSVYSKLDEEGVPRDYQLSILGSVLPAVTYNFEF